MKRLTTQFLIKKSPKINFNLENFFISLILLGIPLNLYKNRFYDNSWNVGEWLISYAGGFVRRGLPGQIIYFVSSKFGISPILIVWFLSIAALVSLAAVLFYFCKDLFKKSFLLSQLIILAPIAEDYFVRKDSLIVLLYGLSLLAIKLFYKKKIGKVSCTLFVNLFSIIAILSHESYGIWGLPSLVFIFYLIQRSKNKNFVSSIFLALLNLLPSILCFLLCWIFKGSINQSLSIHESWQLLREILPSLGALDELEPKGAIAAIGFESSRVYSFSLLTKVNLFIFWHPGMWFLTIFLVMKFFIGSDKNIFQDAKRFVLCSQFIAFLPMFLFVDIGRWIFMWLTSSLLLFAFLENIFGIDRIIEVSSNLKGSSILPKAIPGFNSIKTYNSYLLLFGLPHCCWSIGRYLVSNPLGFTVKTLIFYFQKLLSL